MTRLPFAPGSRARRAHDRLLEARRHGLKALDLLGEIDLTEDQRDELRESVAGVRLALDEVASVLAKPEEPFA